VKPPEVTALASAVTKHLDAPVEIHDLHRRSGGASRETWSFDALEANGTRHALVLRRDPGLHVGQSDRSTEYEVLAAVHAARVLSPRPFALLDTDDGLGAGFLMERVEGETIPRRILRDPEYATARSDLARQAGAQAARIHAVDPAELPDLRVLGAHDQIVQYRELLDAFGVPHPSFELGLLWLAEHAPPTPSLPSLVHGDFRNGNFVVGTVGLRAVLDWELAHLGDPAEDLGWLCVRSWRFGAPGRAGGFGTVEQLLEGYEAGGTTAPDPGAVRYWEAFGTLKWGLICEAQAFTHLHGVVRSVELAALGRRVYEMEWDLLELIDG